MASKDAASVDGESIEAYRTRLERNPYSPWNRTSSGNYHPKPVRQALIPKVDGQFRPLGIPTVNGRAARMAVKLLVELLVVLVGRSLDTQIAQDLAETRRA